jgi:MerR family mercuric resistance operon transcriptional regulator
MKIGEVAKQAGVTVQTMRFYERSGLLPRPERTESGYRVYAPSDLRRVQLIRQAKRLGFSLEEVKRILRLRQQGSCPCGEVIGMLEKHLRDTDEQIRQLQRFRLELAGTLADWKGSGNKGIPGDVICGLIERTIRGNPISAARDGGRRKKVRVGA